MSVNAREFVKTIKCKRLWDVRTANQHTIMMESNKWTNQRGVALSGRNTRIWGNYTIHDFCIAIGMGMFTKKTLGTVGS